MDCPKCGTEMEIVYYDVDYREGYGITKDSHIQEWHCVCPKCKYEGIFTKLYVLQCEGWEEEE